MEKIITQLKDQLSNYETNVIVLQGELDKLESNTPEWYDTLVSMSLIDGITIGLDKAIKIIEGGK